MQPQIDFVQSRQFAELAGGLPGLEEAEALIHGIFIELHPLWCAICDNERSFAAGLSTGHWPIDIWSATETGGISAMRLPRGPYDVGSSPDEWTSVLDRAGKNSPFLVKMYVEPTIRETIYLRRRIEEYANKQPFFCAVIDAPIPSFALNIHAAADLHATSDGTLGGYMKTPSGEVYGVTCAHVAQSPAASFTLKDVGGRTISPAGSVSYSNFHMFNNVGRSGSCNPYVTQSTTINVDLALLNLDGRISPSNFIPNIGNITDMLDKDQLNSYSELLHMGASSGPNSYEIQGYGYMTKITDSTTGDIYCFCDIFDLATVTNNRFQRLLASLPVSGDSGSWLIYDDGHKKQFFGMLLAVEKSRGIGMFATEIRQFANSMWSVDLYLV